MYTQLAVEPGFVNVNAVEIWWQYDNIAVDSAWLCREISTETETGEWHSNYTFIATRVCYAYHLY